MLWVTCSAQEPFLNMVMKIYNENRDVDPSEYMDIAKGCVEGFLQMVMKSL